MTTFRTFASGSSGNAALLVSGQTRLLIDMGLSCRRICQCLSSVGLNPGDLTAILVTHEHIDHKKGLAVYTRKYRTPVYCTPGTARQLIRSADELSAVLHTVPLNDTIRWPEIAADVLPTSHDCPESSAFHFTTPDGRIGYLTDTGYIPDKTARRMLGADLLVLESNHDLNMLWVGSYSYPLKVRVSSNQGHLSNAAAADFAAASAKAGTSTILLAHLSRENNTPALALETARRTLSGTGWTGCLETAPCETVSRAYCLEKTLCSE